MPSVVPWQMEMIPSYAYENRVRLTTASQKVTIIGVQLLDGTVCTRAPAEVLVKFCDIRAVVPKVPAGDGEEVVSYNAAVVVRGSSIIYEKAVAMGIKFWEPFDVEADLSIEIPDGVYVRRQRMVVDLKEIVGRYLFEDEEGDGLVPAIGSEGVNNVLAALLEEEEEGRLPTEVTAGFNLEPEPWMEMPAEMEERELVTT